MFDNAAGDARAPMHLCACARAADAITTTADRSDSCETTLVCRLGPVSSTVRKYRTIIVRHVPYTVFRR